MPAMTEPQSDYSSESMLQISDDAFRKIATLVYDRFGINLTDKKKALVRGRLHSLVKASGMDSFDDYYEHVLKDESGLDILKLIDKISTNHSFFFREPEHLEFLKQSVIPEIVQVLERQNDNAIRIWSAGSAAGEEAYSIAMVLTDHFGYDIAKYDIGILATDISVTALEHAVEAAYVPQKIEGVPERFRRYFKKLPDGRYQVVEKIRKMVLFKRLNLMRPDFPFKGRFHVIFCRNVMIYFDLETRKALLEKFNRYMHPEGYLFIGHSETLGRDTRFYRYVRPTIYKSTTS